MNDKNQDTMDLEQEKEIAAEEVKDSQAQESEIDKCQKEILLWKDQCKRISAEFENFKKRTERDQFRWAEMAKEAMVLDVLQFVDDFDRAMQQEKIDSAGIVMVYQSLTKFLDKYGVKAMEAYDEFDPQRHEAVMQVEVEGKKPGQIVDVFAKGYLIGDKILRPAKVSVAK